MIENPRKEAPARIERIRLKVQGFKSTIKIIQGKKNPADYLSRHPLPYNTCFKAEKTQYADVENHIFYMTQLLPEAITPDRIRSEIPNDPLLMEVKRLLETGQDPSMFTKQMKRDLKPFFNIWEQLSIGNHLILRGEKFVLPKTLISDAISLSHSGHMGISKSKQYQKWTD